MINLVSHSYPNFEIPWLIHLPASNGQGCKIKQKKIFQVLSIKDFQNFAEHSLEFMIIFFLEHLPSYTSALIFRYKQIMQFIINKIIK